MMSSEVQEGIRKNSTQLLEFWDNYHGKNCSEESKEWILKDSHPLLKTILLSIPSNDATDIRMLEIGCGTSRLSRSLLEYIFQRRHDSSKSASLIHHRFHITSTDVSKACIRLNKERDYGFINNLGIGTDLLQYRYLDMTCSEQELDQDLITTPQDIIFDKGCLDTLLFRSKWKPKRDRCSDCDTKSGAIELHPPIVELFLNNLHSMLRPNGGVYLLISPRSKLKAVRDFRGFRSVARRKIDGTSGMIPGDLESGNLNSNSSSYDNVNERTNKKKCAYAHIYTCVRNDDYIVERDDSFVDSYGIKNIPLDCDVCPKCGISFLSFRSEEAIDVKGAACWTRRWKGHFHHCI
jgi:hypothetical protein